MCEFGDAHGSGYWAYFNTHLQPIIEQTQRGTLGSWSRKLGDAPGGHNCANLEAVIQEVWRYALGGHDGANLEAVFRRVGRCTCRVWSFEHAGHNRVILVMHLEAVIRVSCRGTWRWWSTVIPYGLQGHGRESLHKSLEVVDGGCGGCWDFIHLLL